MSDNQVIPEAAVEAAARMIYQPQPMYDEANEEFTGPRPWEWLTPEYQDSIRKDVRAALEAAAPHMLAEAWEAGSIAGWVESGLPHSWHAENSLRNSNPYRSAK